MLHLMDNFPQRPGYAAVFEVESVSAGVEDGSPAEAGSDVESHNCAR